jgi:hypothetical protein
MSRILKVHELVTVTKEYKYEVSDEMSDEEFLNALENTDGEIYEVDDDNPYVEFIESEYLFETEEHYNGSETLVFKGNTHIGTVV